jgi:hypothetical protein
MVYNICLSLFAAADHLCVTSRNGFALAPLNHPDQPFQRPVTNGAVTHAIVYITLLIISVNLPLKHLEQLQSQMDERVSNFTKPN